MKSIEPKRLRIMGKPFKVTWVPKMQDEEEACGKTDPRSCWIKVDADLPLAQKQDTLLHEVLHCIWYEMGIHNEAKEGDLEETIITRLATGLTQVMKANPSFLKYLQQKK